jgi:DNA-directed RNA polymerase subunit M/transcription elongation factor TFIIS
MFMTRCPSCNRLLNLREELIGKLVSCPACKANMKIPSPVTATPKESPPPRKMAVVEDARAAYDSFAATCPSCQAKMHLNDQYRGKRLRCPECEKPFTPGGQEVVEMVVDEEEDRAEARQPRRPNPDDPTVQCYDCRYPVAVDNSMSMLVNTGHSAGHFSGSATGAGGGFSGLGVGVGRFSGSSTSEHFGKVDLCGRCCSERLEDLKKQVKALKSRATAICVCLAAVDLMLAVSFGWGIGGFAVGLFVSSFIAAATLQPLAHLQTQIKSAVMNGRQRFSRR